MSVMGSLSKAVVQISRRLNALSKINAFYVGKVRIAAMLVIPGAARIPSFFHTGGTLSASEQGVKVTLSNSDPE